MNNEPVAWMYQDTNGTMKMLGNTRLEEWVIKFGCKEIPLYTHPAKTLTDEEILRVHSQMMEDSKGQLPPYVDFARAILRKAQEK
jgi:hypothetical protein